jgi:hypothetical protein
MKIHQSPILYALFPQNADKECAMNRTSIHSHAYSPKPRNYFKALNKIYHLGGADKLSNNVITVNICQLQPIVNSKSGLNFITFLKKLLRLFIHS